MAVLGATAVEIAKNSTGQGSTIAKKNVECVNI